MPLRGPFNLDQYNLILSYIKAIQLDKKVLPVICAATVNTGHIVKPSVWDGHCCHNLYTDTRSFCSLNLKLG